MFDVEDFKARVLAKARKAEIARILDVPSSRVAELYKEGSRVRLTMEQGMRLAEALDIPPAQKISAETLVPVLAVCLRHAPKEWTDQAVQRLAQEIVFGIELQQSLQADREDLPPTKDNPGRDKPA